MFFEQVKKNEQTLYFLFYLAENDLPAESAAQGQGSGMKEARSMKLIQAAAFLRPRAGLAGPGFLLEEGFGE
ncbi:MAG: hypothetical protein AB1921_08030 [Thermodesulfobacteriota bacterium]